MDNGSLRGRSRSQEGELSSEDQHPQEAESHRSQSSDRSRHSRRKVAATCARKKVPAHPWRIAAVTAPLWRHGLRQYAYGVAASMLIAEHQPRGKFPPTFLRRRLSEYLKTSPGTNAKAATTACWAMASFETRAPASSTTARASSTTARASKREVEEQRACWDAGLL
jgi:hypothetical protein